MNKVKLCHAMPGKVSYASAHQGLPRAYTVKSDSRKPGRAVGVDGSGLGRMAWAGPLESTQRRTSLSHLLVAGGPDCPRRPTVPWAGPYPGSSSSCIMITKNCIAYIELTGFGTMSKYFRIAVYTSTSL